MQWQFRKALQSFQGYKRTTTYKNQIQNGDQNTLDMAIREIELILTDKNQKIIPKVLALRFVRDIMVLGQEDIVKKVEKLVPQLTKICSHQLHSQDPDRGETFFHDHPAYLKLTDEDEKKQIDTLGSTYMILSLQSIYHWAKWVPVDATGLQSIYAKAYQSLVDRQVKFPTSFHYYKQSDTEKFKNMYKMEFFTDSFQSDYSQTPSEAQPSQTSQIQEKQSKASWAKKSTAKQEKKTNNLGVVEEYTGETRGLKTVSQVMNYLNQLRKGKNRKMGDLRQIHKTVQQLYDGSGTKTSLNKEQKRWAESYIINFSLLTSNIIDYDQFLKRSVSQQVEFEFMQQQDLSMEREPKLTQIRLNTNIRLPPQANKLNNKVELKDSKVGDKPQELMKRQEYQFKNKVNTLLLEIQQKNNQLAIAKSNSEKQRSRLIEDYESRINLIKNEVKRGHQDKGAFQKELQKENERLRTKVKLLEDELLSNNFNTTRERDLETERNQLLTKVKKLQLQNDKLNQAKSAKNNIEKQFTNLENSLKERDSAIEKVRAELKKAQKIAQNYHDEAALYKSQLINQRAKHEQRLITATKSSQTFELQNKTMKQKVLQLRKTLDLKEIQTLNLREQLKRYQTKVKDMTDKRSGAEIQNNRSQQWLKSRTGMGLQSPTKVYSPSPGPPSQNNIQAYTGTVYSNDRKLRFNNYQDLYLQLKPNNRQLFIRLCRCALKKKDILFKQNELQIGIISELLADNKVKFILHFTNTSEKQIQNLKIQYNFSQSYLTTLDYQIDNKYVFCIQPQEQEKINVTITNQQPPFLKERAIIQISYEKNGSFYSNNLFLPFVIVKFIDFYPPKPNKLNQKNKNLREVIHIKYNRKMLPKPSSIRSYFEYAQEVSSNKYQMQGYHRQTDLTIRVSFMISPQTQSMILDALVLREKINQKQRYVFEQLVSFLQTAFKK